MINKFKACFCGRGDQHLEDVDLFQNCEPFVQWTTFHLTLILVILL